MASGITAFAAFLARIMTGMRPTRLRAADNLYEVSTSDLQAHGRQGKDAERVWATLNDICKLKYEVTRLNEIERYDGGINAAITIPDVKVARR